MNTSEIWSWILPLSILLYLGPLAFFSIHIARWAESRFANTADDEMAAPTEGSKHYYQLGLVLSISGFVALGIYVGVYYRNLFPILTIASYYVLAKSVGMLFTKSLKAKGTKTKKSSGES